ncbi:MAG: Flp pilus assembly protein CpaB [Verrucomicrobiota bacterium]
MKKKSPPWAIIGAVLLGIAAIFVLLKWKAGIDQRQTDAMAKMQADFDQKINDLKSQQQPVVQTVPTDMRNVYYATQPVDAGVKISPAFYEKKLTPNEILPDAYTDQSDIVGFYAVRKIEKGDPLTPRNIGKTLPYLSQRIPNGMRAISLPIFNAENNATGGFVVDGDKIDLLYTTTTADNILLQTELVLQNVDVLFVPGTTIRDDKTDGIVPQLPPGDPISITFLVTPEQAQALVLMSENKYGKFSMILRGRPDKSEIHVKPFVADDYVDNFKKLQKTSDRSLQRVQELATQIDEQEKKMESATQGTTNETPHPTQPSP